MFSLCELTRKGAGRNYSQIWVSEDEIYEVTYRNRLEIFLLDRFVSVCYRFVSILPVLFCVTIKHASSTEYCWFYNIRVFLFCFLDHLHFYKTHKPSFLH